MDSALARIYQTQTQDPETALAKLSRHCPEPAPQLAALLAAGADNDFWANYHERIARTVRHLLQQQGYLFPQLVAALRTPLDDAHWPQQRIALAALATAAPAMPALYNQNEGELIPLLLRASSHAHSFSARRFAISALSYLREITPEVLAALLRLAGDEAVVCRLTWSPLPRALTA